MRKAAIRVVLLMPFWCSLLHAQDAVSPAVTATINLAAGETRLLQIAQESTDLLISVSDGKTALVVNHPLGSTGPELLLLGPYSAATVLSVRATAIDGILPATLSLQSRSLPARDPAIAVYRDLTEAGRLSQLGSPDAVAAALRLYASADTRLLPPEWRYYPQYLAAEIEYFRFDLEAAKARLRALPADACTMPLYCYKAELLLQKILFDQDEFRPVIATLTRMRKELEAAERSQSYRADLCVLLVDLGISDAIIGNAEGSLPELEAAMAIAKPMQSKRLMGEALNGLATWHAQPSQRNFTKSAEYLQQAVDLLRNSTDDRGYVSVSNNLGITYSYLGELQLAHKAFLQALPVAERSQDASLRRVIYGGLADAYSNAGDWNPAERYYRLGIELDAKSGRDGRQYGQMRSLGTLLREKGKVKDALAMHEQALAFFRNSGVKPPQAFIIQELAFDHLALGHLKEAATLFENVAGEGERGKLLYESADNVSGRARVAIAQGNLPQALQLVEREWQTISKLDGNLQDKMQLAKLLMQIQRQRGDLVAASGYGQEMVKQSNGIRGQLEHMRLGAAWSAHMHDGYREYADLLIDRYRKEGKADLLEQALSVLESSRAQSLLLQRQLAGNLKSDESTERRDLRRRLTEISNRRAALLVGTPDYEAISLEYFQLLEKFQSNYSRLDDAGAGTAAIQPKQARTRLGASKALIEFLCMPEKNCQALVMTDKTLKVFDAGKFADVALLSKNLNLSLRKTGSNSAEARQQLGKLLLGHIMADPMLAGRSELLIVADAPLNNLPFAALSTPDGSSLVQDYSISTIPSLSSWQAEPPRKREHKLDVAVFADPVFSAEAVQKSDGSSSSFTGWLQSLDRLRWSGQEASNLAAAFAGSSVKIYTREMATRENLLKEETRSARILHIASHAYYNESMQDLVGIAFSAADPASKNGDFLTLQELFDSSFQAELVVISGCDTGVGEYQPGEGNLSMARGFIAQGANHVISTLWPVSDRASVEFVRQFYAALAAHPQEVSRALRAAQQALADSKDYSDPFYWAPYVLTAIN